MSSYVSPCLVLCCSLSSSSSSSLFVDDSGGGGGGGVGGNGRDTYLVVIDRLETSVLKHTHTRCTRSIELYASIALDWTGLCICTDTRDWLDGMPTRVCVCAHGRVFVSLHASSKWNSSCLLWNWPADSIVFSLSSLFPSLSPTSYSAHDARSVYAFALYYLNV